MFLQSDPLVGEPIGTLGTNELSQSSLAGHSRPRFSFFPDEPRVWAIGRKVYRSSQGDLGLVAQLVRARA